MFANGETKLATHIGGRYWIVDGRIYLEADLSGCIYLVPFRKRKI